MRVLKVFSTSDDFDGEFSDLLTKYYEDQSYRLINNDSYTRYPPYDDLAPDQGVPEVNEWLYKNGVTDMDYCIIIHWDW